MTNNMHQFLQRMLGSGILQAGPDVPADVEYSPPQGKLLLSKMEKNLERFTPKAGEESITNALMDPEQKFIVPLAQILSNIFQIPPITEEIYSKIDQDQKDSCLFCVISRNQFKRTENNVLIWDPYFVLIKGFIVARIRCAFNMHNKMLAIGEIHLWHNDELAYMRIQGDTLDLSNIPIIFERWVEHEGLLKVKND